MFTKPPSANDNAVCHQRVIHKLIAAALAFMALPASAADLDCAPRDALAAQLYQGWGEESLFRGVSKDGTAMLEFFARPDGTWTLVLVTPDQTACPLATGTVWIAKGVPQGKAG